MTRKRSDIHDLLGRLSKVEQDFLRQPFLAPVTGGGTVRVRIAGIVCNLRLEPADFVGWGVFEPVDYSQALFVREASLAERRGYLDLFPVVRLIVCRRAAGGWIAAAASFGDGRVAIDGAVPLQLATEVQQFDSVRARFDGLRFWFDEVDLRDDPGHAAYLRGALADRTVPADLGRKGLSAEARAAYEFAYWHLVRPADERAGRSRRRPQHHAPPASESDLAAQRLRDSLSHAGAELVDYLERGDGFRVRYVIDGRRYTSSVDKQDLTVQVAGVCLNGEDRNFDLGSLVGVLRQGDGGGGLLRVGDEGLRERDYWRIHPPRRGRR